MIYLLEDDSSIRNFVEYALNNSGFEAKGFEKPSDFWKALDENIPTLVLLDIMLPEEDGIEVLKILKSTAEYVDIPVIMATAKGAEFDKVQGLDLGADDYLVKPFGMMEMISRVKAVMRRCKPKTVSHVLQSSGLSLNLDQRTVTINGEKISLTYKEFELLSLFMRNVGLVFSRDTLYNEIWGIDFVGETRTVDMHIRTLRQKLGDYGDMIETVRHVGYKFGGSYDK